MTKATLALELTKRTNQFKGDTDGMWFETGRNAYMTAQFSNVGQATMFAQDIIWDFQLIAEVTGGDWDDSTIPAQVTIRRYM